MTANRKPDLLLMTDVQVMDDDDDELIFNTGKTLKVQIFCSFSLKSFCFIT